MVRMLAMPICGLLRGSGRLPVAQPSTAGGAGADGDLVLAAFDALQHFEGAVVAEVNWSTPWNWSVMPRRSPTSCRVTPAPRVADSQPPKTSRLGAVEAGDGVDGCRPARRRSRGRR